MFDLDLSQVEWYDNSTLATIDSCVRKGYWRTTFQLPAPESEFPTKVASGIAETVGVAGHFGTCIHAAFDKYYSPVLVKERTLQQRRIDAIRAFSAKYAKLVPDPDLVDNKYSHLRGVDLLDMYFDHYEQTGEDSLYDPIETELALFIWINYDQNSDPFPFRPFVYICRIDGIFRRRRFDDYVIAEHKTSTSPQRILDELHLSRQARGYNWGLKQFAYDRPIEGVMANVLAIRAAESEPSKLFFRDYIRLDASDDAKFRLETIVKVERWRRTREMASTVPWPLQLAMFDTNPKECTRYGKCSYYDLCLHGPTGVDLSKYVPNTWNPLHAEKMESPD